jgi:gliding motility-associated-like protein
MKCLKGVVVWLLLCSPIASWAHGSHAPQAYFVPNGGQWPAQVIAHIDLPALRIFVEHDRLTWVSSHAGDIELEHDHPGSVSELRRHAWQTILQGSQRPSGVQFEQTHDFRINYFIGNDPGQWAANLVPATVLRLRNIYPGIDWVLDASNGFKYEFVAKPGADLTPLRLLVAGVPIAAGKLGSLVYKSSTGEVAEAAPEAWTLGQAGKQNVAVRYRLEKQTWHFEVGSYHAYDTLVLDPSLIASTFTGAASDNWGFTATYGLNGSIFLGGISFGIGYPTTLGAYQINPAGLRDMTISRFNANGTSLQYSTYIGGQSADVAMSIIAGSNNELYILGKTQSSNFPTTSNAYDTSYNGGYDLVVVRLNADGSALLGSTYLGGSADEGQNSGGGQYNFNALIFNYGDDSRGEINLDAQGNVLVVNNTFSTNFPVQGGFQPVLSGGQDGVVVKLNANLTALLYSTYLGGSGHDAAYGIRSAGGDTIYVTGSTFSTNFPVSATSMGYQRTHQGSCDGFLMRLRTSAGQPPLSGTFLGTVMYDQSYLLDTDLQGRVYVAGISQGILPVEPPGVYHVSNSRHFIQRFSPDLAVLNLSTTFGEANANGPALSPTAFLVDICGKIYFSGWGGQTNRIHNGLTQMLRDLPLSQDAIQQSTDGSDMYLVVFEENADSVLYGTYFGGAQSREHVDGGTCRFSKDGVVYHAVCAGCGGNSDFPTTAGAWSALNNATTNGLCNAAVFKIDLEYVNPVAGFRTQYLDTAVCLNTIVEFRSTGTLSGNYFWDFGLPGATSNLPNPTYIYTAVGTYQVRQIVTTCIGSDTIVQNIEVFPLPVVSISGVPVVCAGDTLELNVHGALDYRWRNDSTLLDTSGSSIRLLATSSRWYVVSGADARGCISTDSIWVEVAQPRPYLSLLTGNWCFGDTLRLSAPTDRYFTSMVWEADVDIVNVASQEQRFVSLPPRWVYATLTDSFGCSYRDSIWLNPQITVQANAGPDRVVCGDDSLVLTAGGGTSYLWSTGDTTPSIRVYTANSMQVWVVAFLGRCRSLPDTIFINRIPVQAAFSFSPDTGYAPQEIQFLTTSPPESFTRVVWDFGDGKGSTETNPRHIYRQAGSYRVRQVVSNFKTGCSDTLDYEFVYIDSIQMLLPNAFSPNGDGVNDTYRGVLRNFREFEFLIFDRWGSLIYTARKEDFAWDGSDRGSPVPPGVYPYVLKAIGKNGKSYHHSGQIILIR